MNKISINLLAIGVLTATLYSQSDLNKLFNLERMQFGASVPGAYLSYDRYLEPDDTLSPLNYYLQMTLWVGARQGNALSVISGDGNPTVKEFTEWKFTEELSIIEDDTADTSVVSIYRSVYNDQAPLPGHIPMGITVNQRTYEYKPFPALIFEYTVTSTEALDSVGIGMLFDFDLPEADNTSDPYNDQVMVIPRYKSIFMANEREWNTDMIPAVVVLSERNLNQDVLGRLEQPLTDAEKWSLMKSKSRGGAVQSYDENDDYRFIVHTDIRRLNPGEEITFAAALVHTQSLEKVKRNLKDLRKWYRFHPASFKQIAQTAEDEELLPEVVSLAPNYPNPFNPDTRFKIALPERNSVIISIYDLSGQLVKAIHQGTLDAGTHTFTWRGKNQKGDHVSSGIYFIQAQGKDFHLTHKMILIR